MYRMVYVCGPLLIYWEDAVEYAAYISNRSLSTRTMQDLCDIAQPGSTCAVSWRKKQISRRVRNNWCDFCKNWWSQRIPGLHLLGQKSDGCSSRQKRGNTNKGTERAAQKRLTPWRWRIDENGSRKIAGWATMRVVGQEAKLIKLERLRKCSGVNRSSIYGLNAW